VLFGVPKNKIRYLGPLSLKRLLGNVFAEGLKQLSTDILVYNGHGGPKIRATLFSIITLDFLVDVHYFCTTGNKNEHSTAVYNLLT